MTFKRHKGSHMILVGTDPPCRVVVPAHKNVRVGTLRAIISQAGLTVEAFLAARDGE
jgi:predicted RNA binding protein YcfA (HicA-like mRNA interferase family)